MLNPSDLQQTNFSESRLRLIDYLKNKYIVGNTYDVQTDRELRTVYANIEKKDYQLLKACIVSGDPKLLMGFMKLIALAYLPEAKDAISSGSVTFHKADEDISDKDWMEYNASNIYRPTLNLIHKTVSAADFSRINSNVSGIPLINCSITAKTTLEKLTNQIAAILKKIPADQVFDELLHSVDPTYQSQEKYAEIRINIPSNK